VDGDVWTTSAGVFAQINGATQQLGGVTITSWTPTITFASPGNLNVTYSAQAGETIRVAGASQSVCMAFFNVSTSTFTYTTASGVLIINGLSPVANASWAAMAVNSVQSTGITGATGLGQAILGGISSLNIKTGNANNPTTITAALLTSGQNISVTGQLTYAC